MSRDRFNVSPNQSIREAFVEASSFLANCGVLEPQRNAQLLLEHVLELTGTAYYMALSEPFPAAKAAAWMDAVTRKASGEPAQYIIGEQEFYGLLFNVTSAVLIPRPETELLVEAIQQQAARIWPGSTAVPAEAPAPSAQLSAVAEQQLVAADIGTGSGAIAVTLAVQSPRWRIHASDISPAALRVAEQNAARHAAAVAFHQGDLLAPFAGMALDIVVSNPPYIPASDIAGLQREVRDFEPRMALDGGADGLLPYRIMMEQLIMLAAPPRLIGFELGMGQAGDVAQLLSEAGHWDEIVIVPDFAGIERHVLGVRV
ncbi:peptide chain release factor N(5)-glutamine methyltransferase [Paenibacillus sp. IHBB 10380]|uniref:peptide chain release factor N(5)-glutamine methyltransferase n=1 Tax=Paenibacillus sp. IHBB 10380 TaxID=1566358 RepID=UPI0005CFBE4A|nr:peptide chain release factor N(5)-glutamine methyltransferase [Paenibacillus sp. IHBB 10380]AJS60419.1 SAM-dependent methyltransferase [Paenibacillus sp. IHBB 10380]